MAPRVPLHVEGLLALRERYPAAIAEIVDQRDIVHGMAEAPSGDAKHVFDTPDGWRLIVSRERLLNGQIGIHISASVHDAEKVISMMQSPHITEMNRLVIRAWQLIAGSARTPRLVAITEGGIPHFFLMDEEIH
jgi:hypothetical protein